MKNIVLFGPPGAGKGTQATLLKEKYQLVHISTGDVFRDNIKNKTELGLLAKTFMDKGDLVPDNVTISMLEAEVDKNATANGFIFVFRGSPLFIQFFFASFLFRSAGSTTEP